MKHIKTLCGRCRFYSTVVLPPKATDEQIFRGLPAQGTSLATEEDWDAAVAGQQEVKEIHNNKALYATNRIGQVALPTDLITSINEILRPTHHPSLTAAAYRFYDHLSAKSLGKQGPAMPPSKDFTELEVDAYIAGFVPQLYAPMTTILKELRKQMGLGYAPAKVLDLGMGPGTATRSFMDVFNLPAGIVVQSNGYMRHRTRTLLPAATVRESLPGQEERFDLIMAPHTLSDLKGRPSDRLLLVRRLWSQLSPSGVLILMERGNPLGFDKIVQARAHLMNLMIGSSTANKSAVEGRFLAPCPHEDKCPLQSSDHFATRRRWCHFSQRLQRPDFLQRLKHAKENTEDVSYSYLVAQRSPRAAKSDPRIILPPLKRHKHVIVDVCADGGLERHTIPKSQDKEEYTFARRAHWGDTLPYVGKSIQ